jgi:putative endonuclease
MGHALWAAQGRPFAHPLDPVSWHLSCQYAVVMPDARQQLGSDGERIAEKFLRRQRYTILQRNYRCRLGEVDLIALDRGTVVFVEVKTRRQAEYGNPLEAVDRRKQQQIQRAAQYYVSANRLHDRDLRFDVVGVWWQDGAAKCELVRNAFEATV